MTIINTKKKVIVSIFLVLAMLIGGVWYYQEHYFGNNVRINGVSVGGLTSSQALKKLTETKLNNDVYINKSLVIKGKNTSLGFTDNDRNKIEEIFKKQFSFLPSFKVRNYSIKSSNISDYRTAELRKLFIEKLRKLNDNRKKEIDAYAILEDGKVKVVNEVFGKRYDINKMIKQYDNLVTENSEKIVLKENLKQPLLASSKKVMVEKEKLEEIAGRKLEYIVQNTAYELNANEILNKARYKNGKYNFETKNLSEKIQQINTKQATLGKPFKFKTSGGNSILVQDETYGWALKESDAISSIETAFEKGTRKIDAKKDIYGKGYLTYGTGYENLSNNGIGDSYAEVSLSQQHVWVYKEGKLVVSADVVTGKQSTNEDTPKGVWYVMYRQSPSILRGSESGVSSYEVKVKYWAQFTNSGVGFHDANWRHNWASNAYLNDGSGGCVNCREDDAQKIYDNVSQGDAVVVY